MGFGAAFAYDSPAAIFREHARLSAFENDGARDFDIGAVANFSDAEYDVLQPFQWPRPAGVGAAAAAVRRRPLLHARAAKRSSCRRRRARRR